MYRAYVGLSSPVGYDYRHPAEDGGPQDGFPSPVLVGVTGLLVLYDEIWFPYPGLCPASMRGLPYVRFASEADWPVRLDDEAIREAVRDGGPGPSLNDIGPGGFGAFMERYYGSGHPDNHSRGAPFLGSNAAGNPSSDNLLRDLLTLDGLDRPMSLVLNRLTRQMAFPEDHAWLRDDPEDRAIALVERVLTIASIYELTGPEGPYHPVLEELRGHDFVESFRRWARAEVTAMDNREREDVVGELNAVVREFGRTAMRAAVGDRGLRDVSVKLLEGVALDLVPGSKTVKTALDMAAAHGDRDRRKLSAFVAESRGALWEAHGRQAPDFF